MQANVLVLDATWSPVAVIPWQRAISQILGGKANLLQGYDGRAIRSQHASFPLPAVVVQTGKRRRNRVRFSRRNVLARDSYRCAYCGEQAARLSSGRLDLRDLTLDHVIPRSRSVDARVWTGQEWIPVTSWQNIVTACSRCNFRKANQTPGEAGMPLRFRPRKPHHLDAFRMRLTGEPIPEEWKNYLPRGSEWSLYWDVELDPS